MLGKDKDKGEKPLAKYDAEYIGGHPMYPKKQDVKALPLEKSLKPEGGGKGSLSLSLKV